MVTLTRRQVIFALVPLLALLAIAGARLARTGTTEGPARAAPLVPLSVRDGALESATASRLVVHVVGAVRRAGLYRLPEGARVADAVERAGGATARADIAIVNLAAPLADGQQVVVPRRAVRVGGVDGVPAPETSSVKVSLAAATLEQLDTLPGIGPVTAKKILDWRQAHGPIRSVDDLDRIPGIGPARVEQLRDLVTP